MEVTVLLPSSCPISEPLLRRRQDGKVDTRALFAGDHAEVQELQGAWRFAALQAHAAGRRDVLRVQSGTLHTCHLGDLVALLIGHTHAMAEQRFFGLGVVMLMQFTTWLSLALTRPIVAAQSFVLCYLGCQGPY